ncbi:TfoX/Sxy family protein [Cellulomonas sp. JH27-2]|uniref:TfoX/Sxy family protein n=1 Tax=Cellulomonas sp. JH27-2 TaxID=2774139 RepID=UPI00178244E3|nr:TfoX/Sxy family protein [Cellulomonas sp. JH27-2]MBD8059808.1 TfoX/Sxy family protein [Cellulomonas sp. JH27-2]
MYDEALAERVRPLLADQPEVTEKRMFGGLAFLVAGHMGVAVSGQGGLMVRVLPERTAEHLAEPGAAPMEMRGREMRGWLRVDAAVLDDDDELAHWVELGTACARSLPPQA